MDRHPTKVDRLHTVVDKDPTEVDRPHTVVDILHTEVDQYPTEVDRLHAKVDNLHTAGGQGPHRKWTASPPKLDKVPTVTGLRPTVHGGLSGIVN